MSLARYLARLGYGTRKEAERLLQARRVTTAEGVALRETDRFVHDDVRLDGTPLDPPPNAVVLLNKPVGYVCSTSDRPPLVYDLLSPRFLQRTPVMATVGRLDADTSGLLLLTDDGALNHLLTSPRSHVTKTYVATLAHPLRGDEVDLFGSGSMMLQGETSPLLPAALEMLGEREAALTLREGRYHQVRRMFAAVGNHVVALRRTTMASLSLGALPEGAWRVLEEGERGALVSAASAAKRAKGSATNG